MRDGGTGGLWQVRLRGKCPGGHWPGRPACPRQDVTLIGPPRNGHRPRRSIPCRPVRRSQGSRSLEGVCPLPVVPRLPRLSPLCAPCRHKCLKDAAHPTTGAGGRFGVIRRPLGPCEASRTASPVSVGHRQKVGSAFSGSSFLGAPSGGCFAGDPLSRNRLSSDL